MAAARFGDPLTLREKQIVQGWADGKTNVVLAAELRLGYETVRTHAWTARVKLGALSQPHAVAKAIYLGDVSVGPPEQPRPD